MFVLAPCLSSKILFIIYYYYLLLLLFCLFSFAVAISHLSGKKQFTFLYAHVHLYSSLLFSHFALCVLTVFDCVDFLCGFSFLQQKRNI